MRHLILGVLLGPLFIALLLALFGVHHSLGGEERFGERGQSAVIGAAGALALTTTYLLARQPGRELTFHWLFLLGLICLCLALASVLEELGRVHPWDPSGMIGYQILDRALAAILTLVLGLVFLIVAIAQDHAKRSSPPSVGGA